jgi:hypothetical protein
LLFHGNVTTCACYRAYLHIRAGEIKDSHSFERIWNSDVSCGDSCKPPAPGQKMHYFASGSYYSESGLVYVRRGGEYHIKVRLAGAHERCGSIVSYPAVACHLRCGR